MADQCMEADSRLTFVIEVYVAFISVLCDEVGARSNLSLMTQ